MRIAGYIDDPLMKITLLEMNHRFSIKFELDGMEQTYKLPDGTGREKHQLEKLLTLEMRQRVVGQFRVMKDIRKGLSRTTPDNDDVDFPTII
ncbi:MAG: hypothetical protein R3275_09505 [Saprospiraceae bacterium]|nr:hypothetical protein [Saprospiraceae bacterium]